MEEITIEKKNLRCDYEGETKTGVASYRMNYSTENGELRRVSASVSVKETGERGNISYENGKYVVNHFPYGEVLDEVMADFRNVVKAVEDSIANIEA